MGWRGVWASIRSSPSNQTSSNQYKANSVNIFLVGSPGYNLGDDAISAIVAERLMLAFPEAHLVIATNVLGRVAAPGAREFLVERRKVGGWLRLLREIQRADVVLIGGGTLIQDALGCGVIRGMIPFIWQVTLLARVMGKMVATVPIGVDRLTSSRGVRWGGQILRRCNPVLLRDPQAMQLAKMLAPDHAASYVVSADPVFSLASVEGAGSSGHSYLVLSYVREARDAKVVENEVFQLVIMLRAKWPDLNLVLLAMEDREEDELGVFRNVMERVADERVRVEVPSDFRQAANILRHARAVVAMRLHAMIITLGYAPLVGISRATKTETLMSQASIVGLRIDQIDPQLVEDSLVSVIDDSERLLCQRKFVRAAADRFDDSLVPLIAAIAGNAGQQSSSQERGE